MSTTVINTQAVEALALQLTLEAQARADARTASEILVGVLGIFALVLLGSLLCLALLAI